MSLSHINTIQVTSGADFNKHHKGTIFYKFLNDDLVHHNFKYTLGLNTDIIKFNTDTRCSAGGLYFCEESKCHLYWRNYGKKLALVKIPNDAVVCIENNKFKSNKIIIKEITDFNDVPDKFWIKIRRKD